MNRRRFLAAVGGSVVALAGGTAVASATRADLLVDGELTRATGEPTSVSRTLTSDAIEFQGDGTVVENGTSWPVDRWERARCAETGARAAVETAAERVDGPLEGVGSGVRALAFGPVLTVDHTVTRGRDGEVESEPNVPLDRLVATAPRTVTVSLSVEDRTVTRSFPVGVGHVEVQYH